MKSRPFPSVFIFSLLFTISLFVTGCAVESDSSDDAGSSDASYKQGELLVKYKTFSGRASRVAGLARHAAIRIASFSRFDIDHVRLDPGVAVEDAIRDFQADPDVEYAEPNYQVNALDVPNDPLYANLWGMTKISAPTAWATTVGSPDVVVGVIDTGIDYNHPDLAANAWFNPTEQTGVASADDDSDGVVDDLHGFNAVLNNGNPFDDNGHGTHVSGTIGAQGNNGKGVVGVNWKVKILACKSLNAQGAGYVSDAVKCMQYFRTQKDRGVNLVAANMSWGGPAYSQALFDALNAQRDILYVAAAGNSGTNNDATAQYPASYNLPNIVAVAATTSTDTLASFSCYGRRSVDIAAPGNQIASTYPNGSYAYMSGTSMATPHVTGLAALLKAKNPSLDAKGLRNLILSGGTPLAALKTGTVTGRRIDAAGSLNCTNSPVFSILEVPNTISVGVPTVLSALSINCANSVGPVTVTLAGGEVIQLKDDGVSPDLSGGDGVFTAIWTPTRSAETFLFASAAGTESYGSIAALTIATGSLPSFTIQKAYSQSVAVTGGAGPYAFTLASGTLPPGLSLNATTGAISGTPTAYGTYSFALKVTDKLSHSVTKTLSLASSTVAPAISTTTLSNVKRNAAYSFTLSATGGTKPYAWTLVGSLPAGLTLNSTTGVVSGKTTAAAGTYRFDVRLTDALKFAVTKTLSIAVIN